MIADSGLALILQLEANPIMSTPGSHAHSHSHVKTEGKGIVAYITAHIKKTINKWQLNFGLSL
jgi:hypothetical protein